MSEIEIGEYIRTKDGIIDKVIKYDEILEEYWCKNGIVIDISNRIAIHLEDIIKHSKNIKKLIEEGDFVNGYRITKIIIETNLETKEEKIHLFTSREDTKIKNLAIGHTDSSSEVDTKYEPIRTILTHEMYENNCYKVEE